MAETLGGLYIRLGLSLSDLESDFIAAEKTIAQNMANLSRESNLISLRAEVDIGNLDPAIDAVQILTIREQALNEQLQIQRDKIKLAAAAVQDLTQKHGASASITQRAESALKREEIVLQRLQRELQGVKDAQQQLNSQQPKGNFLTAAYGALKGNMPEQLSGLVNSFDKLKSVTGAADGAITKALETIGNIPTPVTVAVAAIAALPVALKKVEDGILDLAKPAIESGDAFYVWSRGVQMSIADAEELSMVCKVTGIEVSEVTSAMRRLDMQLVKSTGNDALSQMLQRYAVETRNANGEMKNALELSQAIADGLSKAQTEGRGKDFISAVLGRSASGDLVTYFEDLAGNIEFAKTVVRNGLFDPTQAHAIQGNINAMNAQAEQLGGAFSSALMPVANEIVPKITERMGELTKVIADNADGIKNIGFAVGEVAGYVSDLATEIVKLGAQSTKWVKAPTSAIVDKYKDDPTINSIHDLVAKELDANHSEAEKFVIQSSERLYAAEVKRLEPAYKKIKEYKDKINEELKGFSKSWADFQRETDIFTDQTESLERVKKILEEIEKIKIDLKFGSDTYGKSLAELDFWYKTELEKAEGFGQQRAAISELYAAKVEQIEQEKEDRVAEIREQAERARRTDLENTLADIEREKEKRISTGMEAAEAIELAAQESAAAIRDVEDAFTEKVNSFRNSALQNQYDAIDKERDDWIKKGVDPERANAFADEQRYKALQDLEESFSAAVNDIRASDLEKQLARIEQEKQAWIDKGIEEARAEELANEQKAQVLQDYADKQQQAEEQRAKAIEEYNKRVAESMERQFDEALSVLKSQLDAFKAYRDGGIKGLEEYERKQLKKQGITDKDLESMTKGNLDDFNQAQKDIKRNLLPNFQPVNDVPFPELPPIETPKAFAVLNSEIYRATDALENFAETADGKRYYLNDLYNGTGYAEDADGNRYYLNDLNNTPNPDIPNYMPQDNADFNQNLNQPVTDPLSNLGDFDNPLDRLSQEIAGMTQGLNDTVKALSEMTSAIAQVGTPAGLTDYPQTAQNPPANINTTIQIEEAHAWDYDHIRELAELVADILSPVIVNAVGGDSNGY